MAEALSQSQIDELLNRMRSGNVVEEEPEGEAEKVKEYDFASPKKFTKDQIKSLNNLYENFCRVLGSYFTTILRNVCEITVTQIEEQRYYEFSNALPDNALVGMIGFTPGDQYDETTLMLDMSTSFGYLLIDRMMGGAGELYAPDRDYTEIETALLELVMGNVVKYLKEAWSNYMPVQCDLRSIETNGRLIQAYQPQDIVVIISLEIKTEEFSGMANLCMPGENLEGIISSFSARYAHSAKAQNPDREKLKKELIYEYLKQSNLTMVAVLDDCVMDLGDVLRLQVGDIIALNKKINDDICVKIEGNPWYSARMGESGQRKSLKLVDSITD